MRALEDLGDLGGEEDLPEAASRSLYSSTDPTASRHGLTCWVVSLRPHDSPLPFLFHALGQSFLRSLYGECMGRSLQYMTAIVQVQGCYSLTGHWTTQVGCSVRTQALPQHP